MEKQVSKKTLFMETTEIPCTKTAAEITEILVRAGATQISLDYQAQRIVGLKFTFPVDGGFVPFALPVRVDPVFAILNGRRPKETWKRGNRQECAAKDREQAERVAWRQLLRWVQAQLAMIDTGMVQTHEVFMPYVMDINGQTFFERFAVEGLPKLLAMGGAE